MGKKTRLGFDEEYERIKHSLNQKYYNLFRSQFKWTGLNYRQEQFIMNKFYAAGQIAAWKLKHLDELGFANWAMVRWDMYGEPEEINLLNEFNSPLVPMGQQVVDKDVVIGYCQFNKKPVKLLVDFYIDRIAQIEYLIKQHLDLCRVPFLIPVEDDKMGAKIRDIVDKVLNGELVITAEGIDPAMFKAVATLPNFIIDKLFDLKKCYENELKTFLSINNNGVQKQEQVGLSESNANNIEVNDSENCFLFNLQAFCERVKDVLGVNIGVEGTSEQVVQDGVVKEYDQKPGPEGEENNEN